MLPTGYVVDLLHILLTTSAGRTTTVEQTTAHGTAFSCTRFVPSVRWHAAAALLPSSPHWPPPATSSRWPIPLSHQCAAKRRQHCWLKTGGRLINLYTFWKCIPDKVVVYRRSSSCAAKRRYFLLSLHMYCYYIHIIITYYYVLGGGDLSTIFFTYCYNLRWPRALITLFVWNNIQQHAVVLLRTYRINNLMNAHAALLSSSTTISRWLIPLYSHTAAGRTYY